MSTTIPALTDVTDILDTDHVVITHSNGQSYKIAGSELNKRNQVIIATGTTITGTPLKTGNVVRVYFTAALSAANGSTALVLKYNNVNYTVKVPKNGALQNYVAFDIGGGTYKYLQAYTTLELIYDGTNFVILGNPVVLSDTDYTIYADGLKRINNVTETKKYNIDTTKQYIKISCPYSFCYIVAFTGTRIDVNSTEIIQGYGSAGIRYDCKKICGTRNSPVLQAGSEGNTYFYGGIESQMTSMNITIISGTMPNVEFVDTL